MVLTPMMSFKILNYNRVIDQFSSCFNSLVIIILISFRVFKRAARTNAQRLILVGNSEWQKGMVGVKILSSGEQYEIKLDELE